MNEYRGWQITSVDAVQLGYRTGEGMKSKPGKGRKMKGYALTYAPDSREKFVTDANTQHIELTLADAEKRLGM